MHAELVASATDPISQLIVGVLLVSMFADGVTTLSLAGREGGGPLAVVMVLLWHSEVRASRKLGGA